MYTLKGITVQLVTEMAQLAKQSEKWLGLSIYKETSQNILEREKRSTYKIRGCRLASWWFAEAEADLYQRADPRRK